MDILEFKAIAIAKTEAQTEVAPFIPQSQGAMEPDLVDASFIPRGNAIPIKNPRGKSIAVATKTRIVVVDP